MRDLSHLLGSLFVGWLLLAGCQPITPVPSASSPSPTPGRLAYIGADGNVYVSEIATGRKIALTIDATVEAEGNGRSYHRLAWSAEGRLAYAAVERTLKGARSQVYVATPGQPAQLVGESESQFVIYLYWSPQPCATACHLAYLIEGEEAIDLHLVEFAAGRPTDNRVVGTGRPFYFTWSPDGKQMFWHTGGSRQNHPDASLTRYTPARQETQTLTSAPGFFLAPAWSPTGESWVDVIEGSDGSAILRRVLVQTGQEEILATAAFDIAFVWSPDGRQVAYASRRYGTDPFLGPIYLYDVARKTTRRLTDETLRVQAFFWSPDGQRLAYLHWLGVPNENWVQWRIYHVAEDEDRGFAPFVPTFHMRMVIGSFGQFVQSHAVWSPEGRYLLYADRDRQRVERVWVIDTWAEKGVEPILVAEGVIGVWAWR